MISNNDPLVHNLNLQLNSAAGIKKYQETKKVMADFEMRFKDETIKTGKDNVNLKFP